MAQSFPDLSLSLSTFWEVIHSLEKRWVVGRVMHLLCVVSKEGPSSPGVHTLPTDFRWSWMVKCFPSSSLSIHRAAQSYGKQAAIFLCCLTSLVALPVPLPMYVCMLSVRWLLYNSLLTNLTWKEGRLLKFLVICISGITLCWLVWRSMVCVNLSHRPPCRRTYAMHDDRCGLVF